MKAEEIANRITTFKNSVRAMHETRINKALLIEYIDQVFANPEEKVKR